jgi:hypothetical protein
MNMDETNGEEEEGEQTTDNYFSGLKNDLLKRLRKVKFFIEVTALVVVIIYTRETKKTNHLTERALDANAIQFRIQQRPYISAIPRPGATMHIPKPNGKWNAKLPPVPPGLENGGDIPILKEPIGNGNFRLTIAVDIKNSGRSPAIDELSTPSTIIVGPATEARERARKYVPDYPDRAGGTLMIEEVKTVSSDQPVISAKENEFITEGVWELYIVGGVRYQDTLTPRITPYETTYCFKLNVTNLPFAGCEFRETILR